MSIKPFVTTVVGSLPKPPWLQEKLPLNSEGKQVHGKGAAWLLDGEPLRRAQDDAVRVAIHDQTMAGIDIISDGEQRRTSYLAHVVARLEGFDYGAPAKKWIRNNRRLAEVGRCTGDVSRKTPILLDDLRFVLEHSSQPVRITLPGPMTVVDSTLDEFYRDERSLALAVANALNEEARALDTLGPAVIQFDEPVFSRYPAKVAEWGIDALDRCVEGISAKTCVHVCYSYPMPGVPRPITDTYPIILRELERSKVDQLALEFEASGLDPGLLTLCPTKTVLFGCIDNGALGFEHIETAEQVANRLLSAAEHMAPDQIQAAPDCGLVPLDLEVARQKLKVMVEGARLARTRL
jgi:5-methyltetrahydropteroyltriglutamate--homocysteine methyltransferase